MRKSDHEKGLEFLKRQLEGVYNGRIKVEVSKECNILIADNCGMLKYLYARTDMTVRLRNGTCVQTDYDKPITVVKYIHDAVVVATSFGVFILSPSSVAYVEGERFAAADIKREGGRPKFEPRPEKSAEELKDVIRAYLPDSLPPQLRRYGDKIYLGDVEVGTVYVLS